MKTTSRKLEKMQLQHNARWRDSLQICSQWEEASRVDPKLLVYKTKGRWWEILGELGITLLVSREYEHLVMAMSVAGKGPQVSYFSLPHPSGIAMDSDRNIVYVASTRNPNQIYDFAPVKDSLRNDSLLVPVRSRFFPGKLYLHDLAFLNKALYGNAVGENSVVRFDEDGSCDRVWWPKCVETKRGPHFEKNYIQLNSIASARHLNHAFFSASTDKISQRRPGHRNFSVDKKGVIFSALTREPVIRNLTRPHSARVHRGSVWVDNSGYGEMGVCEKGQFQVVAHLPGWTRGLCFKENIAFVGTSRVIPRFSHYAPGLAVEGSLCGLHAVDIKKGTLLGSLIWPWGNQIFAVHWLVSSVSTGFPFRLKRSMNCERNLFYSFRKSKNGNSI